MKSLLIILSLLFSHAVLAADTPSPSRSDPVMDSYQAAVQTKDWKAAAQTMRGAVESNPLNPDYHNLYAYSLRKAGAAEMDLVFKHYNEALRLDPKHRGAHEYSELKRAISEHEAKTAK